MSYLYEIFDRQTLENSEVIPAISGHEVGGALEAINANVVYSNHLKTVAINNRRLRDVKFEGSELPVFKFNGKVWMAENENLMMESSYSYSKSD
jgi:hypothetical protein